MVSVISYGAGIWVFKIAAEQIAQPLIFIHQRIIGSLEVKIIFDIVDSFINAAGNFLGNTHEGCFMKFVIAEQHGKRNDLQQQEKEKIQIPPNE